MTHAILNQSLFLLSLLMVFGAITIPLVGNWIASRRMEKASMDALDIFHAKDAEQQRSSTSDVRNHFLQDHKPSCSSTVTMFAQWEDDDGQVQYDEIKACALCMEAHEEEGYSAVVLPDQPIDLRAYVMHKAMRERTKRAFSNVIQLHPEQAA